MGMAAAGGADEVGQYDERNAKVRVMEGYSRATSGFDNLWQDMDNNFVNVSLPTTFEEFIRRKVATGEFRSADEVVCEGLRLLQQQEEWKAIAREKIDLGWEQAKSGQLRTTDEVRENLGSRKAVWKSGQS
jgi:putative addiction module CopG family antidote